MHNRVILAVAALAVLAAGQGDRVAEAKRRLPGVRLECSSLNDRYEYCHTHAIGSVRLERQLSKTACRQYETWGANGDGSGVWVKNGCRGVFVVERGGRPGGGQAGGGKGTTITCTSKDFAYAHCDVPTWGRRIHVERQLSDRRCVQGDNWGVDWHGIWVDRGCNAVFAVR
ncbi:MAG: DUF3011 domain-containing protein [Deltaproteobacteria bacterium]|nr:DUF3011 domain-containing protein [Deltaproteobacteria bacterium]